MLRKAANHGETGAMMPLADLLAVDADGMPRNVEEARRWYQAEGSAEAIRKMNALGGV
jgi:TPR repeat protein